MDFAVGVKFLRELEVETVLIRLAHTAKIDAVFQTESGVPLGFQAPEDDRAAEFDANLARKWGFLFGVCANRISTG